MKKKYIISIALILIFIIVISIIIFVFLSKDKEEKICNENCQIGDKVILKDGSSWHVISRNSKKLTLFSDATIDLEGNYCNVDPKSVKNTGQPVAFDKENARSKDKNPYCIYPEFGCSAYEKNNTDVFEDSNIKQILDSKYIPKMREIFNLPDLVVRLMTKDEFIILEEVQKDKDEYFTWLHYSGFWLMTPNNPYSVFVFEEGATFLSVLSPVTSRKVGIRPVVEIEESFLNGK